MTTSLARFSGNPGEWTGIHRPKIISEAQEAAQQHPWLMRLLVNGLEAQGMGLVVASAAVIEPPAPADGATSDELTLFKIRMASFEKDETRRKDFITTCNKLMADNVSDTIKLSFASWGTSTPATKLASMDTAYNKLSDKQAMAETERFNYTDKLSLADNIANFQRAHRALSGNVNMLTPAMAAAKFRAMIEAYISKHSNFDMNNAMSRDVGPLTSLSQFFDLAVGWAIMYAAEPTKFAGANVASGRAKERTSGKTKTTARKDNDLGYFTLHPDASRGDKERIRNQAKRPPTDRHGHNAVKCDTHGWCGHSNAECSSQRTKPKASAAKARSHATSETDESSIESDDLAIYQKVAKKKGRARANVARNILNQLTSGSSDLAMDDTGASHTFLTTKDAGKYGYDVKALEPPLEIGVADDHGTESSAEANKTCTIDIFGTPRKVHIVDTFQRSLIGNDVKEQVMSVTLKGVSYYFDISSRTGLVIKTSTQNPDSGLFDFNLEEQKHAPAPDSVRAELERIANNVRIAKASSARTGIYNLSMRTIANLVTFIVLALACCSSKALYDALINDRVRIPGLTAKHVRDHFNPTFLHSRSRMTASKDSSFQPRDLFHLKADSEDPANKRINIVSKMLSDEQVADETNKHDILDEDELAAFPTIEINKANTMIKVTPPKDHTPAEPTKPQDLRTYVAQFSTKTFMDEMGAPEMITGMRDGSTSIAIFYNEATNCIWPVTVQPGEDGLLDAVKEYYSKFGTLMPQYAFLDNKCPKKLRAFFVSQSITFETDRVDDHRRNKVERHIWTGRSHVLALMMTADTALPPQCLSDAIEYSRITLNILRESPLGKNISAWQAATGMPWDWERHPLIPFGWLVEARNASGTSKWDAKSTPCWMMGPNMQALKSFNVLKITTKRVVIADRVDVEGAISHAKLVEAEDIIAATIKDNSTVLKRLIAGADPKEHQSIVKQLIMVAEMYSNLLPANETAAADPIPPPRVEQENTNAAATQEIRNQPVPAPRVEPLATGQEDTQINRCYNCDKRYSKDNDKPPRVWKSCPCCMDDKWFCGEEPCTARYERHEATHAPAAAKNAPPGAVIIWKNPQLEDFSIETLRWICGEHGIDMTGTRTALVARIMRQQTPNTNMIGGRGTVFPRSSKKHGTKNVIAVAPMAKTKPEKKVAFAEQAKTEDGAARVTRAISKRSSALTAAPAKSKKRVFVPPGSAIKQATSTKEALTTNEFAPFYRQALDNELADLESNIPIGTKTPTMTAIKRAPRGAIVGRFTIAHRIKTTGEIKIRLAFRGDIAKKAATYTGKQSTHYADSDTRNIWFNSVVSEDSEERSYDIEGFYLCHQLEEPLFAILDARQAPDGKEKLYRIDNAIWGSLEAGQVSKEGFNEHFATHNIHETVTKGLYRSTGNDPIDMLVVVDDLRVKVPKGRTDLLVKFEELLAERYVFVTRKKKDTYMGPTYARDRESKTMTRSYPGFVNAALKMLEMENCKMFQLPIAQVPIEYGNKYQKPREDDDSPPLSAEKTKILQKKIGIIGYYALAHDHVLETASAKCQARLSQPTEGLMAAVDHILGYMRMHPEREFTIKASDMIIVGYCDSTWNTERKSFSRGAYIFAMTSRHNERGGNVPVAIMSRVQRILGVSAFEAEYIALYEALMKCEYLRKILLCMGHPQERTTIFCDNSSAVAKANGKLIPKNSRHIAMRLDWIEWVCMSEGKYETKKIATGDNVSDFLTKPQPIDGIKAFLAFSQGTA